MKMSEYHERTTDTTNKDPGSPILQSIFYITSNIYCKSCNLPNTYVRNYSIDLW